jgi:hypothetical protein
MIIFITTWLLMAALATTCGFQLDFPVALAAWAAAAAVACAGGAFLIFRQPIGIATLGGHFGCSVVRWGFRAGQGKLVPATLISWLIWLVLGSALIGAIHFPNALPIILVWMGDSLGLCYVLGVTMANRRSGRVAPALVKFALCLVGLIAGSAYLWVEAGTDGARAIAVALAGGPPLFVGIGYGFVFAMGLFGNRRHN